MNISSKHFDLNFAHNIVIHWWLFLALIEVYISTHTKKNELMTVDWYFLQTW